MTMTLGDAMRTVTGDAPIKVGAEFLWHRDWPESWERALRSVSPKSDVHGWLHGTWEPGEEWVPGQRWVLYEMLHPKFVSFDLLEEYEGPHPRKFGHYCSVKVPGQFQCLCKRKLDRWRGGPCAVCHESESACSCAQYTAYSITATQYRLFKETGYIPRYLFWVIQGAGGGHKAFFTDQEEDWLTASGKTMRIPYLGQLPYADFDERVVAHINRLNALKQYGDDLVKYRRAMGPDYQEVVQQRLRGFRESVVSWFDQQMKEECDLFVRAADAGEMDDLPKTDIDYDRLCEESIPEYIETGQVIHPSRL